MNSATNTIRKVSQAILQHNDFTSGSCIPMSRALVQYMNEKYAIRLITHTGFLVDGQIKVPHMWVSYHGRCIDLTSHKQDGISIKPIILKEAGQNRIESNDLPPHFIEIDTTDNKLFKEWFFDYLEYKL